mmetsp:Transcript_18682/g.36639  ORF Transcript_18682/g.36639 Transcript_18682/m.36639 type:complete len:174 (-) Transcript_18682:51-572(-)
MKLDECSHQMQQLLEQSKSIDDVALVSLLPHDPCHCLTSIGSIMHECGECQPCRCILMSEPCALGLRCPFCHFHTPLCSDYLAYLKTLPPQVEQPDNKPKARICRKGKKIRDRYKNLVSRLSEQIMNDPSGWTMDSIQLPNYVGSDAELKNKLFVRLATVAKNAGHQATGETL